jgi:sec-independent protein translocase protein TatA
MIMGSFSIWHWLIVLLVVVLIFGTKKLRNIGCRPRRRRQGLQGRHEAGGEGTDTAATPRSCAAGHGQRQRSSADTVDVEAKTKG